MSRRGELNYYEASNRGRKSRRRGRSVKSDYRNETGGGRKKRRFGFFDWVVMAATVGVAVGFAVAWMARWINPASYGFLSSAGLFAPAFWAANFIFLLYWVIRWRRGVWIPLAVGLWGMWSVTLFFRPQLTEDYRRPSTDRSLIEVVTYNVRGMLRYGSGGSVRSSMAQVSGVVDSLRPDILCIQEFASTEEHPASSFESKLGGMNYRVVRYNIAGVGQGHGWGNAIYSKFPIAGRGYVDFDGTNNSILWADVAVRRDTIRVFNAHLQTTAIKADDERYIVEGGFVEDRSRVRGIVGRLTQNYVIRAVQADTLAARIAASPYPVVVCGDFNDTPSSYSYRVIARRLRDAFREAGRGYGYTYRGFFNLLRIDYMLHSRSIDCVDYISPSFDISDHNPVAVKLKINPNRK